jgi:hypothetical protein
MPSRPEVKDTPSSVTQIAAAMAALGLYGGANTPAEHAAEARRLAATPRIGCAWSTPCWALLRPRRW